MKTAIVLAGGGAKGAYQAGSIKALRELGYEFDIVVGTSIGALNGLLVVQQDYQALYTLWENITVEDVMKYPITFDFSIDSLLAQKNLMPSFFKSFIHQKGADISPLISLIKGLYNPDKAFNSSIDYGLVTVNYPELLPKVITKKEMHADNMVDYAIASASCFPAFPIYYIENQGYIDGGYYDNLPISLALELGAEHIITIELKTSPIHEYFLDRPSVTRIRPSSDLGKFLDFSKEAIDQRIKLGYFDTYKTFQKYKGYKYTFDVVELPIQQQTFYYESLLQVEDRLNRVSPRIILGDVQPLTNYLKNKTYNHTLNLDDYLILALEATLDIYNKPFDQLYDYHTISNTVFKKFIKEYRSYSFLANTRTISIKKLTNLLKNMTKKESIYYVYQSLISKEIVDTAYIANSFPKTYLVALYFYTLTKT